MKPYNPWSFKPPVEPGTVFSMPTPLKALVMPGGFFLFFSFFMFFVDDAPRFGVASLILGALIVWGAHWHWKRVARQEALKDAECHGTG